MATLLLTALGTALGGPIGGAIGALAGQRVDQTLFAPKGRSVGRLANVSVQTSSYGSTIPRLYGRVRVAGTVIWATDLREERRRVSQGKGRPKATVYSYSASFAVLLAARPISGIGRIWADGKLLRGAAGDFKVETGFRLHSGKLDQPPDPLIVSAEGVATPAYRGRAYAVFEDLALESFGNRIPMLSFEVFAEDGEITTATIVNDLAPRAVIAQGGTDLAGYVVDGGTMDAAIAPLDRVAGLQWRDDGVQFRAGLPRGLDITVPRADLGASADPSGVPPLQKQRAASATIPSRVELGFSDPDRDYQPGVQAAGLAGEGRMDAIELPAVLTAASAAANAQAHLFDLRRGATVLEIRLPWRQLAVWNADLVALDGAIWRLRSVRLDSMCLVVSFAPHAALPLASTAADGGRAVSEPDQAAGRTVLALADLPSLDATAATAPLVVAVAAGTGPGWRSAALLQRNGRTGSWTEIGGTSPPGCLGHLTAPLPAAAPHLMDLSGQLTVTLVNDHMTLLSVSDEALWSGANLALIGDELVQFGTAERVAPAVWRLSRLPRCRRGTAAPLAGHEIGARFLLVDVDQATPLTVPVGIDEVAVLAKGVGDPEAVEARLPTPGKALRPLPPVHIGCSARPDGGLDVRWIRQSREGWRWLEGVDVPLGEETELYRATLSGPISGTSFGIESPVPAMLIPAERLAVFRSAGDTHLEISVRQVGRFAVSDPAPLTLTL